MDDTKRLEIAISALRQISRNKVNGAPTLSAAVANGALKQIVVRPVKAQPEISFIQLPL